MPSDTIIDVRLNAGGGKGDVDPPLFIVAALPNRGTEGQIVTKWISSITGLLL